MPKKSLKETCLTQAVNNSENTQGEHYQLPIRVYYEDTDAGGIVYYANYLKFMERARTEWLRELGFEQDRLRDEYGLIFVVRAVNIEYFKPALFNDLLTVSVSISDFGKTHITCQQQVFKLKEQALETEVITDATVSLVCIDAKRFRPMRIPDILKNKMMDM
jgi:acyl-CoA thioester hydrolase